MIRFAGPGGPGWFEEQEPSESGGGSFVGPRRPISDACLDFFNRAITHAIRISSPFGPVGYSALTLKGLGTALAERDRITVFLPPTTADYPGPSATEDVNRNASRFFIYLNPQRAKRFYEDPSQFLKLEIPDPAAYNHSEGFALIRYFYNSDFGTRANTRWLRIFFKERGIAGIDTEGFANQASHPAINSYKRFGGEKCMP